MLTALFRVHVNREPSQKDSIEHEDKELEVRVTCDNLLMERPVIRFLQDAPSPDVMADGHPTLEKGKGKRWALRSRLPRDGTLTSLPQRHQRLLPQKAAHSLVPNPYGAGQPIGTLLHAILAT